MATKFTNAKWQTPESELSAEEFCAVCLIDLNPPGAKKVKEKCYWPIRRRPGGPVYIRALRNVLARAPQTKGVPRSKKEQALRKVARLLEESKE